jgi:hypothetical protein
VCAWSTERGDTGGFAELYDVAADGAVGAVLHDCVARLQRNVLLQHAQRRWGTAALALEDSDIDVRVHENIEEMRGFANGEDDTAARFEVSCAIAHLMTIVAAACTGRLRGMGCIAAASNTAARRQVPIPVSSGTTVSSTARLVTCATQMHLLSSRDPGGLLHT